MQTEFEIKVLDIDIDEIKKELAKLGAKYVGEKNQKRYVYDFNPASYNRWIRLRTDGNKTTLCIKEILDESKIDGTQELEIIVDDFEKTNQILELLGYNFKAYQENIRTSYILENCEIEIDQRPMIPTYLEIEGPNQEAVENILGKFNTDGKIKTSENTTAVYKRYGVNDLDEIRELKF